MRTKRLIIAATVAIALSLGVTGPAFAESNSIQPTPPAPAISSATNDAIVAKLNLLRGTQTSREINAILNSGQPAEGLFDPLTGKWVAAYLVNPLISTQKISLRGPGCAATDACATTASNVPNGFYGTGQKDVTLNTVKRVFAGDKNTTWYYGTSGYFLNQQPGVGANLTSNINIYGITRS